MFRRGGTEMVQPLIMPDSGSKEDPLSNLSRSLDKENECELYDVIHSDGTFIEILSLLLFLYRYSLLD